MHENKVNAFSSKIARIFKKGAFTKVAAVFTKRKAEPKAESRQDQTKEEPEVRADVTVTIADQPTEVIAPAETITVPSLSDTLRIQLNVIKKHSGDNPNTIDPRHGNMYCEDCRDLRSVAHALGKDKDKEFYNFTGVNDDDIRGWEWWVDSYLYKKYSLCHRCEETWDEGCDISGQLVSHWAPHEYDSQQIDPYYISVCVDSSHPECALAYYEKKYGPSTKWFVGENDCVYSPKMTCGRNKVIDRCICGENVGSEKIIETLSWAFGGE